jgi:hypothetical protein
LEDFLWAKSQDAKPGFNPGFTPLLYNKFGG